MLKIVVWVFILSIVGLAIGAKDHNEIGAVPGLLGGGVFGAMIGIGLYFYQTRKK